MRRITVSGSVRVGLSAGALLLALGLCGGCTEDGTGTQCGTASTCHGDNDVGEQLDGAEPPLTCGARQGCEGDEVCLNGTCCPPSKRGSCGFPCESDPLVAAAGCANREFCCLGGDIYRLESHPCDDPCASGGSCSRVFIFECPTNTVCVMSAAADPNCVVVDGDADAVEDGDRDVGEAENDAAEGESEVEAEALPTTCTEIGTPKQGDPCAKAGLTICTNTSECTCTFIYCTEGLYWSRSAANDVSCEKLGTCTCKTYTLDGDVDDCPSNT